MVVGLFLSSLRVTARQVAEPIEARTQSSMLFDGQKYDNLVEWVNYSFIFRKTSLTRRIKICQIAEW